MFVNKKRDVKPTRTELSGQSDQSAKSSTIPGQSAEVPKIIQSPKLPGPLSGPVGEVPPRSSSTPSSIVPTSGNSSGVSLFYNHVNYQVLWFAVICNLNF